VTRGTDNAAYARRALNDDRAFRELSAQMCWDAVLLCAKKARVINDPQRVAMTPQVEDWSRYVPLAAPYVQTAKHMKLVPPGSFLAFIELKIGVPRKIIHAMTALGGGKAAGNKNDCIGIGHSVGWEELDLAALPWQDGCFVPPGQTRQVMVTYRDIDALPPS
jgi:hypothetical protein